jgi:hypothetical protein
MEKVFSKKPGLCRIKESKFLILDKIKVRTLNKLKVYYTYFGETKIMAKIVISVLHHNPIEGFIYNLNSEREDTILGGGYPYSLYIVNITDSINFSINSSGDNTLEAAGANSTSYHDNKINTVDYSRSIYNRFV